MRITYGSIAENARICASVLVALVVAASAIAARPPDPYDGLPVIEPSATNLSVQLVLPNVVEPGAIAQGKIAYSKDRKSVV